MTWEALKVTSRTNTILAIMLEEKITERDHQDSRKLLVMYKVLVNNFASRFVLPGCQLWKRVVNILSTNFQRTVSVTLLSMKRKDICDKIRKAALTSRQHPSQIIQEITNNITQSAMLYAPFKLALTRLVQR